MSKALWVGLSTLVLATLTITPRMQAATEILYNFDNPSDTGTAMIDNRTADGSQNANATIYNPVTLVANTGPAALGSTNGSFPSSTAPYEVVQTNSIIDYTGGMTWSAAINRTVAGTAGQTVLFWAGWQRGTGETILYFESDGRLTWSNSGGSARTTTATGLITDGVWETVGMTYDVSGTGTLTFYIDGSAIQTFTGVGPIVGQGNAAGGTGASETDFGLPYNLGGMAGLQFIGLADNIFIANRALDSTEMADIQALPEPASLGLLVLGGALAFRRRRNRP